MKQNIRMWVGLAKCSPTFNAITVYCVAQVCTTMYNVLGDASHLLCLVNYDYLMSHVLAMACGEA
jgi:hypothetical protein